MKALVTGHTGFKGTWLSLWLLMLGHDVSGFAKDSWSICELPMESRIGDVRHQPSVHNAISNAKPDIIFHLAAQPLVLEGYKDPYKTFETNIMGTVNVLDRAECPVVVVTSDKVYQNRVIPHKEDAPLGGKDPYSASKAAADIVSRAFPGKKVATARAGNCIGGGDWADNRIVPDIVSAWSRKTPVKVRNPDQVRPFQHVLEPLGGYIALAAALLSGEGEGSWNFGPDKEHSVKELLDEWEALWVQGESSQAESEVLRIDSHKARELGWEPKLSFPHAVSMTRSWYERFLGGESPRALMEGDICEYLTLRSSQTTASRRTSSKPPETCCSPEASSTTASSASSPSG